MPYEAGGHTDGTYTTDADGRFVMSLPDGEYKLTETVPDGYLALVGDIEFKVDDSSADKVILITQQSEHLKFDADTSTLTFKFTVYNEPGKPLPMTGGEGTRRFTVAGALLTLTGLCLGCALRRRERRFGF